MFAVLETLIYGLWTQHVAMLCIFKFKWNILSKQLGSTSSIFRPTLICQQ